MKISKGLKMLGKVLLIITLCIVNVYAYKVDDTLDKNIVNQLKLKDSKIYIIDIFASWCASCKIELPLISKLNNNIDHSKYKIIGIDIEKNLEDGKNFTKNLNLKFKIIYDNKNILVEKFAPIGVPAIYYIKNNKVIKVIYGAVHNIDKKILVDLKSL
jgi:thiol-disulfide isomerase/thioredoxin